MAATYSGVVGSIPRPLTSMIGREQELDQLYDLLRSDARLVTLTGIGGIGKTRLALQAALELEPSFEAGALFVPLASVTRGSSMPMAIAQAAGLDDAIDSVESLAVALGSSSRLLVLDNLEQIPDATPVVMDILQRSPNITVLVASQSRLDVRGEHLVSLEPFDVDLAIPADLASRPAVQLFISRANEVALNLPTDDESIAIIGEIVHMLDGIPLAVELAAARITIFSLPELREQLDHRLAVLSTPRVDMPARQRTMRDAITWTYDLLDPLEQRFFCWLSVYERDFSLDSARYVADKLELTVPPLDLVQFLVSRNLVRQSRFPSASPRYQMLELLRDFGHEQLLTKNEDQLARRSHAMDMAALAERAEPHLTTGESSRWMQLLNDDVPNIYAGMTWSLENDQHGIVQRIFGAIWRYFENTGNVHRILEYLPSTGVGPSVDQPRARALVGIGYLHERLRNLGPSLDAFTEAADIAANLPDQIVHVRALVGLGCVWFDYSDFEKTHHFLSAANQLAERIGDTRGQMTSAGQMSVIEIQLGNFENSISISRRVLKLAEEMGDATSVSTVHLNIGICLQALERFEDAENSFLQSLAVAEEAEDVPGICYGYANLSGNSLMLNKPDECREYGEKALKIAREAGLKHTEAPILSTLASSAHRQKDFGTSAAMVALASKIMDFDGGAKEQIHFASVICEECLELGMYPQAAELLGAVLAMRETLQVLNRDSRADAEDEALAALDPENNPIIAEAMARGAALDRESLVARIQEVSQQIAAIRPPGTPLPPETDAKSSYNLTPRETEVLTMIAKGLTNAEIAGEMFVSTRTVTTHVSNIFAKLDVPSRARAVALSHSEGLV